MDSFKYHSERSFNLGPFSKTNYIIDFKNMFKPNYEGMNDISSETVLVFFLSNFNMFLLTGICAEATFYRNSEI